jgi:hypothetical protein
MCVEGGAVDDGNAVQSVRLDAEGRQESPSRVGLTGGEAKDAPDVLPDDKGDPSRTERAVSVEKDHLGVLGWLDHGVIALLVH